MLEIIILYKLCTRLGQRAREKGRRAIGYQLMLLLLWFGGEFGTALLVGVVLALVYGDAFEQYLFLAYVAAIVGAAMGAWFAFRIVAKLPEAVTAEAARPSDPPEGDSSASALH